MRNKSIGLKNPECIIQALGSFQIVTKNICFPGNLPDLVDNTTDAPQLLLRGQQGCGQIVKGSSRQSTPGFRQRDAPGEADTLPARRLDDR